MELRVGLETYPDLAPGLGKFAGKTIADGRAALRWEVRQGSRHDGRLITEFSITDPPGAIARGMCDLISMTKSAVDGFLSQSTAKPVQST